MYSADFGGGLRNLSLITIVRTNKHFGFTLADVLITLGIIAIVAAMILPAVIANYQEQEYVTRLKKAVSVFEQAKIRAMEINAIDFKNMSYGGVYVQSEHEKFANYFKPYFNVIIDCASPENSNTNCLNSSESIYKIDRKTRVTGLVDNTYRGYITADGVSYFFYSGRSYVVIDVNTPKKKPNSLGYDVFFFQLDSNGKLLPVNDTDTLDECKSTGFSCAKWVLLYGNQAYRKCPEKVEYNRKTKC